MGQQASNQQYSEDKDRPIQKKKDKKEAWGLKKKCDGLLKIEKTPFENCQKIQINDEIFFLQKTRMSLRDLIKNKIRLRKQFTQEEVIRLIQNIVYTLAYLQNFDVPYPDLNASNILISNGAFKLLPPQVIKKQAFLRLKVTIKQRTLQFIPASPQMIIALRCQQHEINQNQILYKSNVFALGIILLQVCTLKPSSQCYNLENYDILDKVITDRIQEIQSYYSNKIARIVANMLDYQFDERMTSKDLSVWVNRQLNETETQEKKVIRYQKYQQQPVTVPFLVPTQTPHEQKPMIKSRLVVEPGQVGYEIKMKKLKVGESSRIDAIRAKIMKQKLKTQIQIVEDIDSVKNREKALNNIRIATERDREKSRKKNLPNPYLVHDHYNKNAQKSPLNKYQVTNQRKDLGIHDLKNLKIPNTNINSRYAYKNSFQQKSSTYREKSIDIKYRYNISEDPDSQQLNISRKRDGQRFVRVEKHLINYQRNISGRKYDYDIGQRNNNQDYDNSGKKQLSRSPSKKKQLRQNHISDFSFQPINNFTNGENKKSTNHEQLEQKPLSKKQNMIQGAANKSQLIKDKKARQKAQQVAYERHQQLFPDEIKGEKKVKQQNEDMLMIRKQIQRSRKIIEEVRRSEQQNRIFEQ